jgi:hypothetical protein
MGIPCFPEKKKITKEARAKRIMKVTFGQVIFTPNASKLLAK